MHPNFSPYTSYQKYSVAEMTRTSGRVLRRHATGVHEFAQSPTGQCRGEIIEDCLRAAGTAAQWRQYAALALRRGQRSGNQAPGAYGGGEEEHEFYHNKATPEWLDSLAVLGTDEHKPFLEVAPYLIVIFAQSYGVLADGQKVKHYYVQESVGIATGVLITALHHAGLVSLTHTPSPMGFLNEILDRPSHERPFLILVVGYPAEDAQVPTIAKKSLAEIATFI